MDETLTPMGGRFLRSAIISPLLSSSEIINRQDAVATIIMDYELMEKLRTTLKKIQDMERLASRVISRAASPRDVVALKDSIERLPEIKNS
ncbi:hypothetical protein M1N54_04035 [Thermodesulfovibrionales bacterium]|nr:hypothetical protein [Thermodesulfovibrionales bacterium]